MDREMYARLGIWDPCPVDGNLAVTDTLGRRTAGPALSLGRCPSHRRSPCAACARHRRREYPHMHDRGQSQPPPQGLYDGQHEHDACDLAFVATLPGLPTHEIVDQALP